MQMGTRFMCTTECQAHASYKQKVVEGRDCSTLVKGRSDVHPVRSIRLPFVHRFRDLERRGGSQENAMDLGARSLRVAV